MKYLLLALLAAAVFLWLTHERRKQTRGSRTAPRRPASGEPMHQCAHCGAFFPASDAVKSPSGVPFCCEEHRRRGAGA